MMTGLLSPRTARCLHLAVLVFAAPFAEAANFQVAPLRLSFEPEQRAVSLTLTNNEAKPVVVEVKVFLWEQVDGVDKLTPTTDLVLTPPLAEVAGNSSQLIRIGRRSTVKAGATERTYRVALQEIIPAGEAAKAGLHFALRLTLPIFIVPKVADDAVIAPQAQWTVTSSPKGELVIALHNAGATHLQLIGFDLLGADNTVRAHQGDMTYVLAGQTRRYAFKTSGPLPAPGTIFTLKANTDAGDQVARVAFAKP